MGEGDRLCLTKTLFEGGPVKKVRANAFIISLMSGKLKVGESDI